jgi:hypothetical protein
MTTFRDTLSVPSSYRLSTDSPMKMEQTACSETLAFELQMPGNYPKENIYVAACNILYVYRNCVEALKRTDHLEDGVYYNIIYFSVAQLPNSGLGRLTVEVSRSQLDTHTHTHTHTHTQNNKHKI